MTVYEMDILTKSFRIVNIYIFPFKRVIIRTVQKVRCKTEKKKNGGGRGHFYWLFYIAWKQKRTAMNV